MAHLCSRFYGLLTAIVYSTSVCYIYREFICVCLYFADGILDEHTASFCRIKTTNPNKFEKRHKHLLIVWNVILNVIGFQL